MPTNYERLHEAMTNPNPPGFPGYYIHGDIQIANGYPTHTHGLAEFGLPEIFINATAFGPQENANVINLVAGILARNEGLFDKVAAGEYIEIAPWDDPMVLCIRKVEASFGGVRVAYGINTNEEAPSASQLYVKGDDHVLAEEYYHERMGKCPLEDP